MMPQRASRRRIRSIRACMVNLLSVVRTIVDGGEAGAVTLAGGYAGGASRAPGASGRRSAMLGFSFRADLAGGERGLDPALMPPEVAADEHGLALLHPGLELHPGELVAAAGEVEEAVPVAVREAHDALGAQDVGGQAPEQALEHRLPERQPGAVDEAPDGVGVQVVGARTPPLAE